jgi:ferredoxin, 2Fe-2S
MPKVIFIEPNGEKKFVDIPNGTSLMQGALMSGVDGIVAECGGSAMCATCHVYIDESYTFNTDVIDDIESEMLECTASERKANSRLSCQITMNDDLDGITVIIPESQN